MRVREVSQRAGVAPQVVRYYVRIGLLRPRRSANNYADFDESDLQRLRFVRKAQRLGFTLDELRHLLTLYDAGQRVCPHVRVIGRRHRSEKAAELRELRAMCERLGRALRDWRRIPDASPKHPDICPLIMECVGDGTPPVDARKEPAPDERLPVASARCAELAPRQWAEPRCVDTSVLRSRGT